MLHSGEDVIEIGSTRIGQKYILGAQVPLDNPNWKGPWDCAEFTSWCAYQAYGQIFGAGNPHTVAKAEPYSGYWFADAKTKGILISWQDALNIPGAALIRAPTPGKTGHVAFSMGNNDSTLEARGAAFGVGIFTGAAKRPWSVGCLLPGVEYATGDIKPAVLVLNDTLAALPSDYLWLKAPAFKGPHVVALQTAVKTNGVDPGPIDGEFGPMTQAAVSSFQLLKGLEVDGIFGPSTATALALNFPIIPNLEDQQAFKDAQNPKGPLSVSLPPTSDTLDLVVDIFQKEKSYYAKTASDVTFMIGTTTSFTDDMNRVGLYQGTSAINDSIKWFGAYQASNFATEFDQWAYFIEPTLTAEGGGRFATLNTYDRAAFTFGAPQFAAHGTDLIFYLRALLKLPDADIHFPELSLRDNSSGENTLHLANHGNFVDLEQLSQIVRPNGKKAKQPVFLMSYLNFSPTAIDAAELSAAARLMNWLRIDPKTKELQISIFISNSKERLARAKVKVQGFSGSDWRVSLWIMDILHQGRGDYDEITKALLSSDPEGALKKIGWPKYKNRIKTVEAGVEALKTSGKLNGFIV
jgi:hypothetical protein